jgi:3',5'-cyclic AMP phosphodiesterase CpdA
LGVPSHPIHPKSTKAGILSFTLAHLSDVHLAYLKKRMVLRRFQGKRVIGALSWFFNRRSMHRLNVADAVRASIMNASPDHVALTGDLVNIAAWPEFIEAAKWVEHFGPADRLSIVPGNHDAYVRVPWAKGLAKFEPWMTSDRQVTTIPDDRFPFVRMRRTTALIGVNSGLPQSYRLAAGTVGEQQLLDLRNLLAQLGQQGFYRVVMIHHPPLPGLSPRRKALTDAAELKTILVEEGCELVLHGHNHYSMVNWLDSKAGPVPVIGVTSASARGDAIHESAGWNLFHIRRQQGRWQTDMTAHRWNDTSERVEAKATVTLSPP